MPYTVEYPVDQAILAQATASAYGASAAEEQRRYQQQQSLADQEMQYKLDQQAIDALQRQQQIDDANYQFNAGLGLQNLREQNDYQLGLGQLGIAQQNTNQGWQQLDVMNANNEMDFMGQQMRANAVLQGRDAQIVAQRERDAQQQKFKMAQEMYANIEKVAQEGTFFKDQAQYNAAIADVERRTGIPSGAITREFMDQAAAEVQAKRTATAANLAQMTGLTPEELDPFIVDGGNGEFVLSDPQFVESMAKDKRQTALKRELAAQGHEMSAAEKRASEEADYRSKVTIAEGKAKMTYRKLLAEEAERRSRPADASNQFRATIVLPDELPEEVKQMLRVQAMNENPMPPKPTWMQ